MIRFWKITFKAQPTHMQESDCFRSKICKMGIILKTVIRENVCYTMKHLLQFPKGNLLPKLVWWCLITHIHELRVVDPTRDWLDPKPSLRKIRIQPYRKPDSDPTLAKKTGSGSDFREKKQIPRGNRSRIREKKLDPEKKPRSGSDLIHNSGSIYE